MKRARPKAYMRMLKAPNTASAAMVNETARRPRSPGRNISAAVEATMASSMSAISPGRAIRSRPLAAGVVERDVMGALRLPWRRPARARTDSRAGASMRPPVALGNVSWRQPRPRHALLNDFIAPIAREATILGQTSCFHERFDLLLQARAKFA